ncbi:phosphorylase family protein [Phytohabitans rumicis]|uniref:Uncharacterized protein n=1 Tax=Phytohabitans rumicis TaxID=1076125 RepID=A0A6V8L3C6_9ACTN|nr:hypothetical protein [Phytohabitans rumicis]GFJ89478.1 hypothetical protein Prum_031200 [Phytohabitans rumicis]
MIAPARVTIGIITPLPIECAAMRALIDAPAPVRIPGDGNHYEIGTIPSTEPARPHVVTITVLPEDGNRNAAAICAHMLRSFRSVRVVVMCGIAGGVPAYSDHERHVRLGDVVVAAKGIVDYDHVRTVDGVDHLRRYVGGLSTDLLRAQRQLEVQAIAGTRPWEQTLTAAMTTRFARPHAASDILYVDGAAHPHPPDASRPADLPRVHAAAIGSADRLLRDAVRRDELAARYGIRAVEMEASGVAVAAGLQGIGWYVVRGIADYCDNATKNDAWHPYASFVAAAYLRALLGACHPLDASADGNASPPDHQGRLPLQGLRAIARALQEIDLMNEPAGRLLLLSLLPREIGGNVPSDSRDWVHLLHIVRTCARYPHGRESLVEALETVAAESSDGLRSARAAIVHHWPAAA